MGCSVKTASHNENDDPYPRVKHGSDTSTFAAVASIASTLSASVASARSLGSARSAGSARSVGSARCSDAALATETQWEQVIRYRKILQAQSSPSAGLFSGNLVTLQNPATNRWLRVTKLGKLELMAKGAWQDCWKRAKFLVYEVDEGTYGFQNPFTQRWLRINNDCEPSARAYGEWQDWWQWERFKIADVGDGLFGLYNMAGDRWLCEVDTGQGEPEAAFLKSQRRGLGQFQISIVGPDELPSSFSSKHLPRPTPPIDLPRLGLLLDPARNEKRTWSAPKHARRQKYLPYEVGEANATLLGKRTRFAGDKSGPNAESLITDASCGEKVQSSPPASCTGARSSQGTDSQIGQGMVAKSSCTQQFSEVPGTITAELTLESCAHSRSSLTPGSLAEVTAQWATSHENAEASPADQELS